MRDGFGEPNKSRSWDGKKVIGKDMHTASCYSAQRAECIPLPTKCSGISPVRCELDDDVGIETEQAFCRQGGITDRARSQRVLAAGLPDEVVIDSSGSGGIQAAKILCTSEADKHARAQSTGGDSLHIDEVLSQHVGSPLRGRLRPTALAERNNASNDALHAAMINTQRRNPQRGKVRFDVSVFGQGHHQIGLQCDEGLIAWREVPPPTFGRANTRRGKRQ